MAVVQQLESSTISLLHACTCQADGTLICGMKMLGSITMKKHTLSCSPSDFRESKYKRGLAPRIKVGQMSTGFRLETYAYRKRATCIAAA